MYNQNRLQTADNNLAYHEQMYRSAQSNPEQLETLNKTKVELQNARNKVVEALNESVLEISQSGLWHLAVQDPSLRTRLEQRMEDMKELLATVLSAATEIHALLTSGKGAAVLRPPGEPGRSDQAMDVDEDVALTSKRRRASKDPGTLSDVGEDGIEKALVPQDVESLQERIATLDSRLEDTENSVHECQQALSTELEVLVDKKVDQLVGDTVKRMDELKADQAVIKTDVDKLGTEVGVLVNEVVEQMNENGLLKSQLNMAYQTIDQVRPNSPSCF